MMHGPSRMNIRHSQGGGGATGEGNERRQEDEILQVRLRCECMFFRHLQCMFLTLDILLDTNKHNQAQS